MDSTLTAVGTGAEDISCPATPTLLSSRKIRLDFVAGDSVEVTLKQDLGPDEDKATGCDLEGIYPRGERSRPGGGALNSGIAAKTSHPSLNVRYLEEGCGFPSLWERLRVLGIEWRHLGFAANPRNVLLPFPSRSGKLILRGALVEGGFAWDRIEALCAWLAEGAVLLNSVKCRALARRIASEAAHRGLPVYAVLTRSLEAAFALDAVAAYARAVFCGSPDSSFLTGIAATGSIDRAADGAEVLGSCTGRGPAFLSLGADGVIVADTDTMDLVHVRCRKGLRRPIQQVVDVNPSCVNGCGDVFAQAATVRLMGVGPWSGAAGGPLAVRAAVDGCLAAVRHLGFEGRLSAGDFDCVRLRPWRLGNLGASGVA